MKLYNKLENTQTHETFKNKFKKNLSPPYLKNKSIKY